MKVLATLAFLSLLQLIAGQDQVKNQKPENHVPVHNSAQQNHEINSHQPSTKKEQQAAVSPTPIDAKVPQQIPPKVQQIVRQVSQHIPQVVEHHVANKQRLARSVKSPLAWQDMQVNALEQPGKCEYICHQVDGTVCGYNGRCYMEFAGQCDLSTYNCLNTQKIFHVVDFAKCQDIGGAKCYRGDL